MNRSGDPESTPSSRPDIAAVVERHRAALHSLPGVVGVAIGAAPDGGPEVVVYVSDSSVAESLPSDLDGYPVRPVTTGQINAL